MSQAASDPYLRTRVMTASPEELRLLLFDAAIKFTRQGHEALTQKDYEGTYVSMVKAQKITLELSNSLNREIDPDLCDKLSALYTYIYRRMVDANLERDPAALEECIELLEYERETWRMLMTKLQKMRDSGRDPVAEAEEAVKNRQSEQGDIGPIASIGPDSGPSDDGPTPGGFSAEG